MVRSPQIARKLSFWWVTLSAYDARDRSLSNRLYLVYVSLFWAAWFLVMFSYFAGPAKTVLQALGIRPFSQAAAVLIALALLGWAFYRLWRAARQSPIVFSENDAHLVCQTPAPGSAVALLWLLGDWFEVAALFWAGAVTLSFALVDSSLTHKITMIDLILYLRTALQAVLLVGLVQLGMLALVWAVGMLRLWHDRVLTWQPGVLRALILAVVLGLAYTLASFGLDGLSQPFWQVALWPIYYPVSAAFGVAPLVSGLLIGLAFCGLGLAALLEAGVHLNLSRAAQETTQLKKIETAQRYGQNELAEQLALKERLIGGHPPSRLPARAGEWMLGWKDLLQSERAFRITDLWGWLGLAAVSLSIFLVSEAGARALLLAIWAVMVGQRVTARLQKDLMNWSLLRMLPFSNRHLLRAEIALPWALVVLLGWLTLALAGGSLPLYMRQSAIVLLPCLSAAVSFAAAYDLLRQSQPELLLNGSAPQVSSVGGLLGILCLALPLGLWFWLSPLGLVSGILSSLLAILLALLFWRLASRRMLYME
jgi:hypothetical protein